MEFQGKQGMEILLLNLQEVVANDSKFKSIAGDARDLKQFGDKQIDIVFSNSVIEHVGTYADQCRMAGEIKRVGKRFFVQTPNRFFPLEPHFLFPFFQFLPLWGKVWLIRHLRLGWYGASESAIDKQKAAQICSSIRLLSRRELMNLFPGSKIFKEKFLGLTKSFIVHDGWDRPVLNEINGK